MKARGCVFWLALGLALGAAGVWAGQLWFARPALAGTDHAEDYIISTGTTAFGVGPNSMADGVWILDYRSGRLLGTIIDPILGRVRMWDQVDLVKDFGISPKQNVHFIMTTGATVKGHTPVYLAEINTGKFAVYGMTVGPNGAILIRKFDYQYFRRPNSNPEP